jgi:hypothetical protein
VEKTNFELTGLLFLAGVVFHILAFRHRSLEYPDVWTLKNLNPKNWLPVWRTASYYDSKGFLYALLSVVFIVGGALLYLIHDHFFLYGAGK